MPASRIINPVTGAVAVEVGSGLGVAVSEGSSAGGDGDAAVCDVEALGMLPLVEQPVLMIRAVTTAGQANEASNLPDVRHFRSPTDMRNRDIEKPFMNAVIEHCASTSR